MIIIGEKINGAIPKVRKAIDERDEAFIAGLALKQEQAGASYIDCCAGGDPNKELDSMKWLIGVIQRATSAPLAIDSPNARLLAQILESGIIKQEGIVNSASEEGDKCEVLFSAIAGSGWQAVALCCDESGIPQDAEKRISIALSIIEKAESYGISQSRLHIDPAVMALSALGSAMSDFELCIKRIKQAAPNATVTGAISNISFGMPYRKAANQAAIALAIAAGLGSAILDPTDQGMQAAIYAAEALCGIDKGGRKYNRAYRQGRFGRNARN
ncbi:MAG: dihydropteroate synthase [Eubacteriaceae bacterium]|nr:dihydropteroate synthase [Eubacteriaceae bacterium]